MTWLRTIAAAFSMFSVIPMPQNPWNEKDMRYMLCAFPLVGAVIGGAMWLWSLFGTFLGDILCGAGLCLIPVLLTGGIHLDGYADTQDALSSHQPPARRQEILKDPHLGAFAVIRLCGYFILDFALWVSLKCYPGAIWLLALCLSRCLSGLAVAGFPLANGSGLAYTFSTAADRTRVKIILTVLAVLLAAGMCLLGAEGAAMAAAAILVYFYFFRMARRRFGGLSGDLSGWFLQTAELWMLAVLCAIQYLEEIL